MSISELFRAMLPQDPSRQAFILATELWHTTRRENGGGEIEDDAQVEDVGREISEEAGLDWDTFDDWSEEDFFAFARAVAHRALEDLDEILAGRDAGVLDC